MRFPAPLRRALAALLLAALAGGCAATEETRRALRLKASLGEDVDPGEFEEVLLFARDRHVAGNTEVLGRACREGLALALCGYDPDEVLFPPPIRAAMLARAGASPAGCAAAVARLCEAWNGRFPDRPLAFSAAAERVLQCILPRLDPHSAWFTPETWADMERSMTGRYSGIGISVRPGDEPVVAEVFEGGPADGVLRKGDVIRAVDGTPTRGMAPDAYTAKIRGEAGTPVTLTIVRGGERRDVTLVRREVQARAVRRTEAGRDRDIVVLALRSYTGGSAEEVAAALRRPGGPPRGVILDLRNNPGGTVDDAVAIVDLFIGTGPVIVERGRAVVLLEADQPGAAIPPEVPLLVLVNRFSASASELTAGALQDHGRAVLMGETTSGTGTVPEIPRLGTRGAQRTVAR
ncbi:MAG: PDZ domain-containing protein, partial [Planctomycetia bacterium]|nr:PDZ domain-containing protein [Planctomycetia bacterium]